LSDYVYEFGQYAIDQRLPQQELQVRSSYPRGQSFRKRNVIFIFVDSLRADHMSVYGYARPTTPFLEKLRDAGRLRQVQLALSTCAESDCGILSTLGSRPFRHLQPENFTLLQLLHDQGYKIYQILSGNHDWGGLRRGYGTEQTMYI